MRDRATCAAYACAMSYDALVVGSGPNGLTAAITLARVGAAGARAGGRRARRRRGRDRGAHAAGLPPRHLLLGVSGRRRLAGVRRACRSSATACAGSIRRPATRTRCPTAGAVALYRDLDRTAASLERDPSRRRRALARVRRAVHAHFDALRDTMLGGFPPCEGLAAAGRGARPARDARLRAAAVDGGAGARRGAVRRATARARGCTARRCTPTCRRSGAGSAIAAAYLNLLGHGAGWPSPEGGAGRLADALVSYLRELGGAVRTGATVTRRRRGAGPRRGRGAGRRRAARGAGGDRRRDARGARRPRRRRVARPATPAPCAATATARRRSRSTGRSTVRFPGARRRRARPAPSIVGGSAPEMLQTTRRCAPAVCPSARSCCSGSSRSPTPRARRRASTPPGPTRTVPTRWTGSAERDRHVQRMEAQVERFAPGFRERILARHVLGPADLQRAQRQPRRRRRGRRQLLARPGHLPSGPVARPLPHAGARPVPRQRGDLPGRRGPRRARATPPRAWRWPRRASLVWAGCDGAEVDRRVRCPGEVLLLALGLVLDDLAEGLPRAGSVMRCLNSASSASEASGPQRVDGARSARPSAPPAGLPARTAPTAPSGTAS